MAAALPLMAAGSLAATAAGGFMQARATGAESQAREAAARYNQQVARNAAEMQSYRGQAEGEQHATKVGNLISRQRATQAGMGLDVNTGSPAAVRASAQVMGDMDAETIRQNTAMRVSAALDQSQLYAMEAENQATARPLLLAASLLGTASSVGSKWVGYQQSGTSLNFWNTSNNGAT